MRLSQNTRALSKQSRINSSAKKRDRPCINDDRVVAAFIIFLTNCGPSFRAPNGPNPQLIEIDQFPTNTAQPAITISRIQISPIPKPRYVDAQRLNKVLRAALRSCGLFSRVLEAWQTENDALVAVVRASEPTRNLKRNNTNYLQFPNSFEIPLPGEPTTYQFSAALRIKLQLSGRGLKPTTVACEIYDEIGAYQWSNDSHNTLGDRLLARCKGISR